MLIDLLESSKAIGLCPMGISKLLHTFDDTMMFPIWKSMHMYLEITSCTSAK